MPLWGTDPDFPQEESVKLGLLIPDHSKEEIIQAAQLAIDEANALGGYKGIPFALAIRTTEGPWGAGSKQSVSLVYEDQVCAILGSLDGRNAHLAEQVATKSHLTYLETYATEPTLSQAFVPWFMRCVPNDNQQSSTLMQYIQDKGNGPVTILSAGDYDTRYAVRSLTRAVARELQTSPLVLEWDPADSELNTLSTRLEKEGIRHLIIPFYSHPVRRLVVQLKQQHPQLHIYGTLAFTRGVEEQHSSWKDYEGVIMICSGTRFTEKGQAFHRQFAQKHGHIPTQSSAYIYDGVRLLIHAIMHAGTGRESIKQFLLNDSYEEGITGSISFDELGNRIQEVSLMTIRNGHPALIE